MKDMECSDNFTFQIYLLNKHILPCKMNEFDTNIYPAE